MNIERSKNVVAASIDASGNVIVGDHNTVINLKEAAQYKDLLNQLDNLNERFNKELERSIKFPDEEDFKLGMLKISQEQNRVKEQIETLKTGVLRLANDFLRLTVNTERLKIAKVYFEKGEFDKARTVLDAEAMMFELKALKEEQHSLKERLALNEQSLRDKGTEFLILARLTSIDFTKPNRLETTKKYFEQSISANPITESVLVYINFLKENNQFKNAYELIPELERLLKKDEVKNDLSFKSNKITFFNLNGFLLQQQGKYLLSVDSYANGLELCRQTFKESKTASSKLLLIRILNNLGTLYSTIKGYDRAIYFAKDSVEEYFKINNPEIELKAEYGIALKIVATAYAEIYKIQKTGNKIIYTIDVSWSDKASIDYVTKCINVFKEVSDINPQRYLGEYIACLVEKAKIVREQLINFESVEELAKTYDNAVNTCEAHSKNNPEIYLPLLMRCKVLKAEFVKKFCEFLDDKELGDESKNILSSLQKELRETSEDAYQISTRLYKNEGRVYLPSLAMCQTTVGFAYWCLKEKEKALNYLLQAQKSYEMLNEETPYVYLEEKIRSTEGIGYLYMAQKKFNEAESAFLKLDKELGILIANKHVEHFSNLIDNLVILSIMFKADLPNKEKSLHYANEALKQITLFDDAPIEMFALSRERCQQIISYWHKKEGFFTRLKRSIS